MCVGSRAVAGGSLQEWLSVRHLGLDHAHTVTTLGADHSLSRVSLSARVGVRGCGSSLATGGRTRFKKGSRRVAGRALRKEFFWGFKSENDSTFSSSSGGQKSLLSDDRRLCGSCLPLLPAPASSAHHIFASVDIHSPLRPGR